MAKKHPLLNTKYDFNEDSLYDFDKDELSAQIQNFIYFVGEESVSCKVDDVKQDGFILTFDLKVVYSAEDDEQYHRLSHKKPFAGAYRVWGDVVEEMYGIKYINGLSNPYNASWTLQINMNDFPKARDKYISKRAISALNGTL